MVIRLNTYFKAKILLYFLNAVNDAHIAQELAKYLRGEKYQSSERTDNLIKLIEENRDELVGSIYTLYFMNGFYDYMFAKWLLRLIPTENRYEIMQQLDGICREYGLAPYQEFYWEDVILVTPLLKLGLGKLPYKDEFEDIFRLKLGKGIRKLAEAMVLVQKLNIVSNLEYVEELKYLWNKGKVSSSMKVKIISGMTKNLDNDMAQIMINSMINTLKAASRWDKLFVMFLKLRFWV